MKFGGIYGIKGWFNSWFELALDETYRRIGIGLFYITQTRLADRTQ